MTHMDDNDPVGQDEPDHSTAPDGIWARGLWMLLFVIMFSVAETILGVIALVQWLIMLFTKKRNAMLVNFGHDLGLWMAEVARFQCADVVHSDSK